MSDDGSSPSSQLGRVLQRVTPTTIRRSLALKLGLVMAILTVSIGLVGFLGTQAIAAQTQEQVEREFRNETLTKVDVVTEWRLSHRISTRLLSEEDVWANESTQFTATLEAQLTELRDDTYHLHLVDVAGDGQTVVASTSRTSTQPVTGVARPYLQNGSALDGLETGDVYVSDVYDVNGQRVVGFVSPVENVDGRVLVLEASLSDVRAALGNQGQRRVEVVDAETGTVMISQETGAELSTYAEAESARRPLQAATDLRESDSAVGVIPRLSANEDVIDEAYTVGYGPIDDSDWVVLVHSPRSAEFGFVDAVSTYGIWATIIAVLLIGLTGTGIGYHTSSAIDQLRTKAERMEEGDLDVDLSTTRIDNIGQLYDGFADMRDSLKDQIQEAEQSRKEAEVARAEAEEMATYLQEKAEEYSKVMQQCAAGDLTQRMSKDGEEESMDRIADEFNEMIEELEKTTGQLKNYVDEVEQAGAEVETSANTVREASEQVADSIQNISDGAYDQQERLQRISETMDSIASRFEEISQEHPQVEFGDSLGEIRQIAGDLEETANLSEETMAESENVAGAAEEQAAELNEVGERAHDLQRYAKPLRDILNRFETEAEHEFVFSVGPTGGTATPNVDEDDTEDESQ